VSVKIDKSTQTYYYLLLSSLHLQILMDFRILLQPPSYLSIFADIKGVRSHAESIWLLSLIPLFYQLKLRSLPQRHFSQDLQ